MPESVPPVDATNRVNTYSPIDVADQVLWPLVDDFWRDNFRLSSMPADTVSVLKGAVINSHFYSTQLVAAVEIYQNDSEDDETNKAKDKPEEDNILTLVPSLTLTIGKVTRGYKRNHIFNKALNSGGISKPVTKSADVVAKIIREYYFATDNRFGVTTSQSIEDLEGKTLWSIFLDDDNDPDSQPLIQTSTQLLDLDMKQLKNGLYVINAPRALAKRLEAIRRKPTPTKLKIKK